MSTLAKCPLFTGLNFLDGYFDFGGFGNGIQYLTS